MTTEKNIERKINTIAEFKGEYPKEIEITEKESIELIKENMLVKEQFLLKKDNEVYFRNVKLKIKK